MTATPTDNAKYRRLRAHGVSHREAVAMSAVSSNADFGTAGALTDTGGATDAELAAEASVRASADTSLDSRVTALENAPSAGPQTLLFSRSGALVVLSGTQRFYAPRALTISSVRATVGTAPTGAAVIVDIHANGTTIFTTQANRPTIAAAGFTDLADAINVPALAQGDYLTIDVDQIGSTAAGSDLTVQIEVT